MYFLLLNPNGTFGFIKFNAKPVEFQKSKMAAYLEEPQVGHQIYSLALNEE